MNIEVYLGGPPFALIFSWKRQYRDIMVKECEAINS